MKAFIGTFSGNPIFLNKNNSEFNFTILLKNQEQKININEIEQIIQHPNFVFTNFETKKSVIQFIANQRGTTTLTDIDKLSNMLDSPKEQEIDNIFGAQPEKNNENIEMPANQQTKGYNTYTSLKGIFLAIFAIWIIFIAVFGLIGMKNIPVFAPMFTNENIVSVENATETIPVISAE